MEGIKQNIPNAITIANLFCGLLSIVYVMNGNYFHAGLMIMIGSICDFLDGSLARLLNSKSEIGKHLDSLADLTTFGIAPGILLFRSISENLSEINHYLLSENNVPFYYNNNFYINLGGSTSDINLISFIGFLIPLAASIRLSRFNIIDSDKDYFTGLPTPASGIFLASIFMWNESILNNTNIILLSAIVMSILMLSSIKIFSIKMSTRDNITSKLSIIRVIFLITCLILFLIMNFKAIPFIVLLYITLSIINNLIP